jgi:NADPH2:quinone reductase
MYAVVIENGHLYYKERPDPLPTANEILVQVVTASINGADLLQLKGLYPAPDGPKDIPGLDLAGTVIAVGSNVREFLVGDRIMALVPAGAQAELALVDQAHCIKLADSIGFDQAGGFMEVFMTAYDALEVSGAFQEPKSILITGAAGGVGTALVQISHLLGSNRVVASTRNLEFTNQLMELGAETVCGPESEENYGPYDIIIELIGGDKISSHLEMLSNEGSLVLIGVSAGSKVQLNVLTLMNKRTKMIGRTLRARSRSEKAAIVKQVQETLIPHFQTGKIKVPIAGIYPMDRPDRAYGAFAEGKKFGKILLTTEASLVSVSS